MIHSPNNFETIIIGAGILGLWAARHAIKRGERVCIIEKRYIGAGASGGFLGALMPHMPDAWNAKKQMQFEGLSTLEKVIHELEADTGLECGYRRCGRIMPIPNEKLLGQIGSRINGANQYWQGKYSLTLQKASGDNIEVSSPSHPDLFKGWINPNIAKCGVQYDTFSARVNPRAYLATLEAYVRPRAEIREGVGALRLILSENDAVVELSNGVKLSAGKVIVANGHEAYPLLQPYMGKMNADKPIGRGVKGQAVLLAFEHDDDFPIVYHDGVYVVPHADNKVAIGSTSLNSWDRPDQFEENDMGFYEKAIELVPALRDAPIIDKWAAVRPRNMLEGRGTEPWFGPVPGHENLIALIGGFKITLGVAHIA